MKLLLCALLFGHLTLLVSANFTGIVHRTFLSTLRNMNCGAQSNFAASEMRNPTRLTGNCVYTIRANSLRVCQLRIDIDTLMLAQPEVTTSRNYMHCIHDALSVDGVEICGTNMATHVYVPWDVQRLSDTKAITMRIANRETNGLLTPYAWSLRVTQIECTEKGALARHNDLRAPAGCLQYFNEPTGVIQSFNLNSQNGPYLGNMNYAICIRRLTQHKQISLTPQFFEMSIETAADDGYDLDCLPQVPTPGKKQDFLSIRDGATKSATTDIVASKFCGTSMIVGTPIVSTVPGPFILHFSSDDIYAPEEKGFRLQYSVS